MSINSLSSSAVKSQLGLSGGGGGGGGVTSLNTLTGAVTLVSPDNSVVVSNNTPTSTSLVVGPDFLTKKPVFTKTLTQTLASNAFNGNNSGATLLNFQPPVTGVYMITFELDISNDPSIALSWSAPVQINLSLQATGGTATADMQPFGGVLAPSNPSQAYNTKKTVTALLSAGTSCIFGWYKNLYGGADITSGVITISASVTSLASNGTVV
jgi:hypothetical protein